MSGKLPQPQPVMGFLYGAGASVMAWYHFTESSREYRYDFWLSASYFLAAFGFLLITPAFFLQVARGPLCITRWFQTRLEQTDGTISWADGPANRFVFVVISGSWGIGSGGVSILYLTSSSSRSPFVTFIVGVLLICISTLLLLWFTLVHKKITVRENSVEICRRIFPFKPSVKFVSPVTEATMVATNLRPIPTFELRIRGEGLPLRGLRIVLPYFQNATPEDLKYLLEQLLPMPQENERDGQQYPETLQS